MRLRALAVAACTTAVAGALGAQSPVQTVFAQCPSTTTIFSERQVQVAARFLADSSRSPRPATADPKSPNVVAFVVDTLGRPEPATLTRVRVTDSALVQRAAVGISEWRYSPAVASGCKVRERVVAAVRP